MKNSGFVAMDVVNEAVNKWLDDTRGLPITLQLTRLGLIMLAELEGAYRAGYEDGESGARSAVDHE